MNHLPNVNNNNNRVTPARADSGCTNVQKGGPAEARVA